MDELQEQGAAIYYKGMAQIYCVMEQLQNQSAGIDHEGLESVHRYLEQLFAAISRVNCRNSQQVGGKLEPIRREFESRRKEDHRAFASFRLDLSP